MAHLRSGLKAGILLTVAAAAFIVPNSAASSYEILHKFKGRDGSMPEGGLVFDASGNLYGVTPFGGAQGDGVVFQVIHHTDGSWTERVLHSFSGLDGWGPFRESLIFDGARNLYGTTASGGTSYSGSGVVFKLAPNGDGSWTESVLYNFSGGSDGDGPLSGLTFDGAGNLYGMAGGGTGGTGVVFKLAPNTDGSWTESVVHNFDHDKDGEGPQAALIVDSAGNLYGTTFDGGPGLGGVVFKLSPELDGSWSETVLHSFSPGAGGYFPRCTLVFDKAGNLYGTTSAGGAQGFGVVFELVPDGRGGWTEKILHNFTGSLNGGTPFAGVSIDASGNLYGATTVGGSANLGVIYKMTPHGDGSWTYQGLHAFQGKPAGYPYDAPVVDKAGNLYGTAWECGKGIPACHGVVFKITQ